jgi:lysine-N-methylase
MQLLKEIADSKVLSGFTNKNYINFYSDILRGLKYTCDASVESVGKRYKDAHDSYYSDFMKENEFIYENFMVNYVFKSLFPFNKEENVFTNYILLVLLYSLLKMHLIGLSSYHKKLNNEIIIKFIVAFSREIEHNGQYMSNLLQLLRDNGYLTMPYMAILIMN